MMLKIIFLAVFICLTVFSCAVNQLNPGGSGGGTTPSGPIQLNGVFVSINGSDTNDGTNQYCPLRTFSRAISNALTNALTNIYASEGVYKPGSGLNGSLRGLVITNSGLHFSGGWDSNFQSVTGYSVLDGTNGLDHVVYSKNISNTVMQGFIIQNGYTIGADTANTNGAGMYLTNLNFSLFTNIIVCSNYALGNGGGIWFCGVSNTFSIGIVSNINVFVSADYGYGGGIFIGQGSRFNTFRGYVSYNSAASGGGMYFDSNTGNNEISCSIEKNTSGWVGGGGIAFYYSDSNHYQGIVNGNTVNFASGPACLGGGVMIYYGCWNLVEGNICSNSGYSGSGGCIWYGSNNTIGAFVYDNIEAGYGGGIYLYYTTNATVSGVILRNKYRLLSNCRGGGLCVFNSIAVLTNMIITENRAEWVGGGICQYASLLTTNGIFVFNNSPDDCYFY